LPNYFDCKLANTASRLIAMGASLVGSAHEVMVTMQCSEADFREYCEGRKELLWSELDRLITLILRERGNIVAKNREFLGARAPSPEREEAAHIPSLTASAGQCVAADYAVLLSSLAFLLRPGRVERLLKLAEGQGVRVPEDLA
jgi:hypothetical protein